MKVILVQKDINDRDFSPYLEYAKSRRVDLICFGELATSGALYQPREVEPFDKVAARFTGYDFAIMTGLPYRADGQIHNSYLYVHKGRYQLYHKINLFPGMNEPNVFVPGTEPGIMKTSFGTVGASICYDIRFPDLYSRLKHLGAQKIFVPAAFPLVRIDDWRNLLIERAKENQVMMIGINAVGDDGTNVFGGTSMVVDADGSILAEADRRSVCLLEVEIP